MRDYDQDKACAVNEQTQAVFRKDGTIGGATPGRYDGSQPSNCAVEKPRSLHERLSELENNFYQYQNHTQKYIAELQETIQSMRRIIRSEVGIDI